MAGTKANKRTGSTTIEQEEVLLSHLFVHGLDHRSQAREASDLRRRISLQPSRWTRLCLSVHIVRVQDDEVALFDARRRLETDAQRDQGESAESQHYHPLTSSSFGDLSSTE